MKSSKPYEISKHLFVAAFKRIKANGGAAGVDGQTVEMFENKLEDNLYKLWNRMSSGSYFPAAVRLCEIPKSDGRKRALGIPTVTDRVAQMVAKLVLEPRLEEIFHEDSYGYRPGKSAHDAIAKTRERCWKSDWVIDMDIKGFFDNIDHSMMLKAVNHHADEKWIKLYVERWLKTPYQNEHGEVGERTKGTPQGGVISPLLANLFLHYVFDRWMAVNFPDIAFERYADDAVIHCRTEKQAYFLLGRITARLLECGLELNAGKTKIVYCKDSNRIFGNHSYQKFDFLGYEFRPRRVRKSKDDSLFVAFTPAISPNAKKAIRQKIRAWKLTKWVPSSLEEISKMINPIVRGWLNYYGKFTPSSMYTLKRYLNLKLAAWAMRKFKTKHRRLTKTMRWLKQLERERPQLFAHWA